MKIRFVGGEWAGQYKEMAEPLPPVYYVAVPPVLRYGDEYPLPPAQFTKTEQAYELRHIGHHSPYVSLYVLRGIPEGGVLSAIQAEVLL